MTSPLSLAVSNISRIAAHPRIEIFLDYDGTLTPIVKRPSQAYLPKRARTALCELNKLPETNVSIISGRSIRQLNQLVGMRSLAYAGNHGLQIVHQKERWIHPAAKRFRTHIPKLQRFLASKTKDIPGVLLENKEFILAIHYRLVRASKISPLQKIVRAAVREYFGKEKYYWGEGKKVWEVRPPVDWHKGDAILCLLRKRNKSKMPSIIFMGDDKTDEHAFRKLGKKALTVFVGKKRPTAARFHLASPKKAQEFLEKLSKSRRESRSKG